MESFEYIDDTDCDAEDDLDWSSFESDNVVTPKPHHKVFSKQNSLLVVAQSKSKMQ